MKFLNFFKNLFNSKPEEPVEVVPPIDDVKLDDGEPRKLRSKKTRIEKPAETVKEIKAKVAKTDSEKKVKKSPAKKTVDKKPTPKKPRKSE